jgi:hypothetical protein
MTKSATKWVSVVVSEVDGLEDVLHTFKGKLPQAEAVARAVAEDIASLVADGGMSAQEAKDFVASEVTHVFYGSSEAR